MLSAHRLCQVWPSALRVPVTGSPDVLTVTLVTLPLVAVTVIPSAGLASWLPLAGVIFRSAASAAAFTLAEAAGCPPVAPAGG